MELSTNEVSKRKLIFVDIDIGACMSCSREGYVINHKKLFRLYREEKLAVRRRGGRKRAIFQPPLGGFFSGLT